MTFHDTIDLSHDFDTGFCKVVLKTSQVKDMVQYNNTTLSSE